MALMPGAVRGRDDVFEKVFIIAEAGVNHNGDMRMACALIDEAAAAGADAVKFQHYYAEDLVTRDLPQAQYQQRNCGTATSQLEMLKRYELSKESTIMLQKHARAKNILFMSTPYDRKSVDMLAELNVPLYKLSSCEVTNLPFLEYVAAKGKPVILSTGASTLDEVREAVAALEHAGAAPALLHCTSCYPARVEDVNLNAMKTLMQAFPHPIGLSDHTQGIVVSIAAAALGAKIIERHFTLDKNLPGPDHKASLEPGDLAALVSAVRDVEAALGSFEKRPCAAETETLTLGRRSIVAGCDIARGTVITEDMLALKRPGTGLAPKHLVAIVGRRAKRTIARDHMLTFDDIEA